MKREYKAYNKKEIIADLLSNNNLKEIANKHSTSYKIVSSIKYRYVTRTDKRFTPAVFKLEDR